jgi:Domain of Unknown Function with PDB structure (DUF3857)
MFLAVFTPFILGSHAQEKAQSSATGKTDFSSESYVVEDIAVHWNFDADGTNSHDFTASILVQSSAAVQRFGLLSFAYHKANETMEIEYVRVRKPDGSVVSTPPDDIQDMPTKVTQEAPFYSDLREKQVPVKGLTVGDAIEFKCAWHLTKPMIPGQSWFAFQFSHDEIVLKQLVVVSVPLERRVKLKSPEFPPSITEQGGRRVYTWTRANLTKKGSSLEGARPTSDSRQVIRGR